MSRRFLGTEKKTMINKMLFRSKFKARRAQRAMEADLRKAAEEAKRQREVEEQKEKAKELLRDERAAGLEAAMDRGIEEERIRQLAVDEDGVVHAVGVPVSRR